VRVSREMKREIETPYLRGQDEIAAYAHVGKDQVREWLQSGLRPVWLSASRSPTPLVRKSWIDEFLESRREPGESQPAELAPTTGGRRRVQRLV
jgi:hypothetical protein